RARVATRPNRERLPGDNRARAVQRHRPRDRRQYLVVFLAVLDREIFRRHLIEKVAELRDLVVETLLIDLLALELDRGLLDHTIRGEDRRLGANRKGDRVRRPRVDLDLAAVL